VTANGPRKDCDGAKPLERWLTLTWEIRFTHNRRAGWLNLPMHTPSDMYTQNAHVCEPTNLVSSVSTRSRCRIASLCLKRYVSFLEAKLACVRASRASAHI
jgi:hypothetical protein